MALGLVVLAVATEEEEEAIPNSTQPYQLDKQFIITSVAVLGEQVLVVAMVVIAGSILR